MSFDTQAFIEYFNKKDHFSIKNGIRLIALEKGYAKATMHVSENSFNYMGSVHGGVLYTLADVAAGTAVVPYGSTCVTLDVSMNYLRPALHGSITAVARQVRRGSKISVLEVHIYDEHEKLLCQAMYTMYMTGKPVDISNP
ncbi:MAG: PaaI family thioesterase [Christensenellaceae bacterium]|jgi:acyl-CoA thioesterase